MSKDKKSKSIKNNKVQKPAKVFAFDEYTDIFTLQKHPVSNVFLDRLAQDLVKWAVEDEDAYKLSEFYIKRGIYDSDLYRWMSRHEELKKAHKTALLILGNRREKGALKKKLDAGIVSYTMAHYDPDWKVLAEWRSKMAKDEGQTAGNITIHMESAPSSSLVPEK